MLRYKIKFAVDCIIAFVLMYIAARQDTNIYIAMLASIGAIPFILLAKLNYGRFSDGEMLR